MKTPAQKAILCLLLFQLDEGIPPHYDLMRAPIAALLKKENIKVDELIPDEDFCPINAGKDVYDAFQELMDKDPESLINYLEAWDSCNNWDEEILELLIKPNN